MNDDEKEMMKNLDLLLNMELVQNESEWEVVQNMDVVDDKSKNNQKEPLLDSDFDSPDELKLDGE